MRHPDATRAAGTGIPKRPSNPNPSREKQAVQESSTARNCGEDFTTAPRTSKYRQKLLRRAMAEVAERPLALALLSALNGRGA